LLNSKYPDIPGDPAESSAMLSSIFPGVDGRDIHTIGRMFHKVVDSPAFVWFYLEYNYKGRDDLVVLSKNHVVSMLPLAQVAPRPDKFLVIFDVLVGGVSSRYGNVTPGQPGPVHVRMAEVEDPAWRARRRSDRLDALLGD
jgi:hypothetical protein